MVRQRKGRRLCGCGGRYGASAGGQLQVLVCMHAHIRVTWCGADLITWQELLLLVVVVVAALHSATCMLPVPLPPPQGPPLLRGSEALEGWESTLFHARHLRHAAEELGPAMYPPQVGSVEGVLYRTYGGTVQLSSPIHICTLPTNREV